MKGCKMKKIVFILLAVITAAATAAAATGINTALSYGPFGFWQAAIGMGFNQENRNLGIAASFAGSRGLDGLIKVELSGGMAVSAVLNPGAAYLFSKTSSRIIIEFYDPSWISYVTDMSSHTVRFFNASQLGGLKIKPFFEIRYSKLLEQAVELSVVSGLMAFRELEDLNAGGTVSWQALDWLQVSAGGNKRFYFQNASAALDATGALLIWDRGTAIRKTAVFAGDYAANLSVEATAWNIILGLGYEYSAYHAASNIYCVNFSHDFSVSAGYNFSADISTLVKGEVINNYYVDGHMLAGFYLTAGADFKVR
jgi:hypothetical protein